MTWIKIISENKAESKLKEFYDNHKGPDGLVDNILKIHSLNPPSLNGHYQFYRVLMYGKSELSRIQRESIAVVVSAANQCHY